jgi:hypothetical protein
MVRKVERVAPHLFRAVHALEFGLTPGFLVPTAEVAGVSFEDQLEMLGGLDDDDMRDELMYDARVYAGESLGTILEPPPPPDEIVASVGRIRPQSVPMARMAIDEPHRLLGVLSDLLSEYWTVFFREEWDRIGPRLGEAVADARRTVAAVGLSHALPSLSRYFGMTASTGELRVLAKELDTHPCRVGIGPGQRLHLVPSIYAWPQVWANCDPPWPLAITYPAPSIEEETRPPIPTRSWPRSCMHWATGRGYACCRSSRVGPAQRRS